ncbi:MAG: hypothetical protein JNL01_16770 [Bdellovibrionales bacterium]|nr:hypothetical protein [Bdellovibrionales bacterium]
MRNLKEGKLRINMVWTWGVISKSRWLERAVLASLVAFLGVHGSGCGVKMKRDLSRLSTPALPVTVPPAPIVSLTSFTGGQRVAGSQVVSLTWSTIESNPALNPVTLEYSVNSGSTWTTIATAEADDGTYSWTTPSIDFTAMRVRVTVVNALGGVGSDSSASDFEIDSTGPTITLTSLSGGTIVGNGTSPAITWNCTATDLAVNPVAIEYSRNGGPWTSLVAATPNDGTHTWNVPGGDADGTTYRFRISAVDDLGNVGTQTGTNNTVDSAGPSFTASSFVINGGATTTNNNTLSISVQAVDTFSPVESICFKDSNTAPTATDACWVAVNIYGGTAATTVNLTSASFTTEYLPGLYDLYVWGKDNLGHISSLTAAGAGTNAQDKRSITFDPGIAGVVSDVVVANTDTPSSPATYAELTAPSGTSVYIKWKITDDEAIPSASVALYYTTDEVNFTTIVTGLDNSAGAGCTLTGTATGCYRWTSGSPTNSYYRIRVGFTDADGIITYGSGSFLNAGNFRLIAGNTDNGSGGSAASSFFFTGADQASGIPDKKVMVVANDGSIYFKDKLRGILKIDPATKTVSTYIPQTGTSTGDGGLATAATLRDAAMISLDYQNRLLIWDHNRIRRVDLGTGIITTFIGGGASTADTVATPTNLSLVALTPALRANYQFGSTMLLDPLPNGDLYFRSEQNWNTFSVSGARIRKYTASTGQITSIYPSGTGAEGDSVRNLALGDLMAIGLAFDPTTSVVTTMAAVVADFSTTYFNFAGVGLNPTTGVSLGATGPHPPSLHTSYSYAISYVPGRDGKLYFWYGRPNSAIRVYNSGSNTWTTISAGTKGFCADGSTVLTCNLRIDDLFVSATGRIYLVDNNMIRVIDKTGKIQTIFGQSYFGGNGGLASSIRLSDADWIEQRNDGRLIFPDYDSEQLWEMTIGGTINKIAGNGVLSGPSYAVLATNTGMNYEQYYGGMAIDPASGDVYLPDGEVNRLNRGTGRWENFIDDASGTLCYNDPASDGTALMKFTGTSNGTYQCDGASSYIIGSDGTNLVLAIQSYFGAQNHHPFHKIYSMATKVQTHFAGGNISGISNPNTGWCADGSNVDTCTNIILGSRTQRSTWDAANTRWLMAANTSNVIKALPVGGTISTYTSTTAAHDIQGFAVRFGTPDQVYYCNAVDGLLYRKTVGGATVNLPFGTSSVVCSSKTVSWDAARSTVIFGVTQNGLGGVAEYYDP